MVDRESLPAADCFVHRLRVVHAFVLPEYSKCSGRATIWRAVLFGFLVLGHAPSATLWAQEAKPGQPAPSAEKNKPAEPAKPGKEGDQPGSSAAAVALYTDAANAQNGGAYDLAIEQWEEFLTKFPQDPLHVKARHYLGVCRMQLKEYPAAIKAFAAVIQATAAPAPAVPAPAKFELLEDSYLNLAWCQFTLEQNQGAAAGQPDNPVKPGDRYATPLASFRALLQKYPQGKYVDQALFFQGECLYQQARKKEAAAAYDLVVKNHPQSKLRADAIYAWGVTVDELADRQLAGQAYDLFLKEFADHRLAGEVRLRKAEVVLQAGDLMAAEKLFAELARRPDFPQVDQALMRQAFCLVKQDKFVEAAELYVRVAKEFEKSPLAAEATLAAGRWYYRAEKMAEAAPWLRRVLAAEGEAAVEAAHWLCRIHLRSQQFAEALSLADQVLAKASSSPYLVSLKLDRADALYDLPNRKADAVAAYLKLATDHPQHESTRQARYNAALSSLEIERYADGIKIATEFLEQFPSDGLAPSARFVRAECRLLAGQTVEAEKDYAELLSKYPDHADVGAWRVRAGMAMFLQKKYADLVNTLTPALAALKVPEQIAESRYLLGAAEFHQEHFDASQKWLAESLAVKPLWRRADETLLLQSRVQQRLNRVPEAQATAQRVLNEFPNSKLLDQAHYRIGEYAYSANDWQTAAKEYAVVVEKYPASTFLPYAQYGLGWCQMKGKEYALAAASFTELLKKMPDHPLANDTRMARGMARRQAGDQAGAIEDLTAFLKANPPLEQRSHALYERGLAEVAGQDFVTAVATFSNLLKDHDKYPDADKVRYELAWAHRSLNQESDAIKQFRELAEKYSESSLVAEARYHVAESFYDQKDFVAAVKEYQLARKKATKDELPEKILYKLGWAHYQLKEYQPAAESFAAQLAAAPRGMLAADGQFMQAECLFQLKKYAEALPAMQAVAKLPGLNANVQVLALLHAGQAAGQLKNWADGATQLEDLIKRFPASPYVPEAQYELGWSLQNLGRLDAALASYEEAATKSRDQVGARARFMMGEIHFEQKRHEEAVKQFQRVMFGYGGDMALADVKPWQAKAGFESGRCLEVKIQLAKSPEEKQAAVTQAKRSYTYVVEKHAQDPLAADARKRLAALQQL
ncbi:MAG: tetratricopeptide repeat protein [Planctomycetota bacterium]